MPTDVVHNQVSAVSPIRLACVLCVLCLLVVASGLSTVGFAYLAWKGSQERLLMHPGESTVTTGRKKRKEPRSLAASGETALRKMKEDLQMEEVPSLSSTEAEDS